MFNVFKRLFLAILAAPIGIFFAIPYFIGLSIYGRPPIVPSFYAFMGMFDMALNQTCKERDYITFKLRMFFYFMMLFFLQPAFGVFWFIDDVFYPEYRNVKIEAPVFIIGDARTGTTQYVQTLANDDVNFCAPITLNALVPMLHAWKIGTFIKSFLSPETVKKIEKNMENLYFSYLSKEFQMRHEGGLWEPDTFEVQYNSWRVEFFTQMIDMKLTAHNWWFPAEEQRVDFLRFLDAIWKKVYYHRGVPGQKMLIKGHFLKECPALVDMYPGSYYVALAREPEPRLMSQINFLWHGPWSSLANCPRTVLKDLTEVLVDRVCEYSEEERLFFSDDKQESRISIPFEGYVKEIDESVKKTYRMCKIPVPPKVEIQLAKHVEEHRAWKQTRVEHSPDFTLEELSVDTASLAKRHEKYLSRCVLSKKPASGKK